MGCQKTTIVPRYDTIDGKNDYNLEAKNNYQHFRNVDDGFPLVEVAGCYNDAFKPSNDPDAPTLDITHKWKPGKGVGCKVQPKLDVKNYSCRKLLHG